MKNDQTSWWNSSTRQHVYLRWTCLVLCNAAFPFFLSMAVVKSPAQIIGVALAVISFIVIYAEVDTWAINKRHLVFSKHLRLSAAIKIATVILPFIDMICGMVAISLTHLISGINLEHVNDHHSTTTILLSSPQEACLTYITTMIDGVLLSLFVAAIMLLVRFINRLRTNRKNALNNA